MMELVNIKKNRISCILLIICLLSGVADKLFGQDKLNITCSFGVPELVNGGVRLPFNQSQLGISFGILPLQGESIISTSVDYYYHFKGQSEFSKRRVWYGRLGLDYLRDESKTLIDKYLYFTTRIGKDINFSKRFGINADAGLGFQLYNETIRKVPQTSGFNLDLEFPIIPAFGLCLFYRI